MQKWGERRQRKERGREEGKKERHRYRPHSWIRNFTKMQMRYIKRKEKEQKKKKKFLSLSLLSRTSKSISSLAVLLNQHIMYSRLQSSTFTKFSWFFLSSRLKFFCFSIIKNFFEEKKENGGNGEQLIRIESSPPRLYTHNYILCWSEHFARCRSVMFLT